MSVSSRCHHKTWLISLRLDSDALYRLLRSSFNVRRSRIKRFVVSLYWMAIPLPQLHNIAMLLSLAYGLRAVESQARLYDAY